MANHETDRVFREYAIPQHRADDITELAARYDMDESDVAWLAISLLAHIQEATTTERMIFFHKLEADDDITDRIKLRVHSMSIAERDIETIEYAPDSDVRNLIHELKTEYMLRPPSARLFSVPKSVDNDKSPVQMTADAIPTNHGKPQLHVVPDKAPAEEPGITQEDEQISDIVKVQQRQEAEARYIARLNHSIRNARLETLSYQAETGGIVSAMPLAIGASSLIITTSFELVFDVPNEVFKIEGAITGGFAFCTIALLSIGKAIRKNISRSK